MLSILKNLQGDIVDKRNVAYPAFMLLMLFAINSFASNSLSNFKSEEILYINYKNSLNQNTSLLVKLPLNYDSSRPWPALVVLHGLGGTPFIIEPLNAFIQISPQIKNTKITSQELLDAIDFAQKSFPIDMQRIYLTGFSMGAIAIFDIALETPDLWAACVPVCGKAANLNMIKNAGNLPFWIQTGTKDTVVPPQNARNAYKFSQQLGFDHWRYTEHKYMGHAMIINFPEMQTWLLKHKRANNPHKIYFEINHNRQAKVYWLELQKQHNARNGSIDVEIQDQIISIQSKNIDNYTLNLNDKLISPTSDIQIMHNGKSIYNNKATETFHWDCNSNEPNDTSPSQQHQSEKLSQT